MTPSPSERSTVDLRIRVEDADGDPLSPVCLTWTPDAGSASGGCDLDGGANTFVAVQAIPRAGTVILTVVPGGGTLSQSVTATGFVPIRPLRLTIDPDQPVSEITIVNRVADTGSPSPVPSRISSTSPVESASASASGSAPASAAADPSAEPSRSRLPSGGSGAGRPSRSGAAIATLPDTGTGVDGMPARSLPAIVLVLSLLLSAIVLAGRRMGTTPDRRP